MVNKVRAWVALLLAVILAHALLPIAPPTVKTSGSPFSASTLEVSTIPSRKSVKAEQVQAQKDTDGEPELASSVPLLPAAPIVSAPSPDFKPRAPPVPDGAVRVLAYPPGTPLSRAPPHS